MEHGLTSIFWAALQFAAALQESANTVTVPSIIPELDMKSSLVSLLKLPHKPDMNVIS